MPSAQQLLTQGPGWQKVWAHRYVPTWASVADKHVAVDAVTFRTAATFGLVLGRVKSKVQAFDQLQRAHHSRMYGLALYRRRTPVFRAVIPRRIGPIPIPGGGATIATVDEYRLVGVHSQIPITWAVVVLVLGLAILVVSQTASGRQAIRSIASDLSTVFGGGQITSASKAANSFILIWVAGGALVAAGSGALYLAYLNKADAGRVLPPPSAGLPPLPPVSGSVTGPRGLGVSGGVLPPAARSTRAPARSTR